MTTITIFDGNSTIEVEVEDSFALTYNAMAKRDELDERRETRRHQSLNASMDNGFDFKDESVDIEKDAIELDDKERLHNAIAKLQPQQQELIRKVYFDDMSMAEIARKENVGDAVVRQRMFRAIRNLKKYLNNF